jgi:CIC family chloride channel protein
MRYHRAARVLNRLNRLKQLFPQVGAFLRFPAELEFAAFWRWVGLSVLVGVAAGLAAALFNSALELVNNVVLGRLAGWEPPLPRGEIQILHKATDVELRRWLLWILPAVGALFSGWIVFRFAPEAEGHGTDAMIHAFHHKRGAMRPRVPIVKGIASVFTMGFGGSAGREGPITQIAGGFGSVLARLLKLPDRERRMLLVAGAAGGLGAIFRIPLGAALFAIEVLYRDGIEAEAIFPCVVSSVVAYSVFTLMFGQGHLFATERSYLFDPRQLPLYASLALVCALAGLGFIRVFYGMRERFFGRLRISPQWRPMIGGLMLGAMAIGVPHALGVGYGWVQEALLQTDRVPFADAPWLAAATLAGLAVAKMISTSLTISSGGSGGVFAPSMVIGGLLGGAFGYAWHELTPGIVPQPGAFVLVGMGCFMGGVSHVPFAAIIMVCEMAGSYDLLVPLMLANAVTFWLLRNHTLYEKQVRTPLESPAHIGDFTIDVLEDLRAGDVCDRAKALDVVPESMRLGDFLERVAEGGLTLFCVAGDGGAAVGLVALGDVRTLLGADARTSDLVVMRDVMTPWRAVAESTNLRETLQTFLVSGYPQIPVVAADAPAGGAPKVVGILSFQDLIAAYQYEIIRRRLEGTRHPATQQLRIYHDQRRRGDKQG